MRKSSAREWALAPLDLYGRGSGDVEAASSLLVRSAQHHSVKCASLLTQVLRDADNDAARSRTRLPMLYSMNGYGDYARYFSKRLDELMTSNQAQLGTMLTWSDVLNPMGHQMLHTERLFCRPCLKGDEAEGRVPYQRLYWCLKPSKACVHHRLTLSTDCLVCRRSQEHVPSLPFLDACQHCGASLTDGPDTSQATLPPDLWKAIEIHGLLEKSQQLLVPVPHERFLVWIRSLCDHHAGGSPHSLARLTGLDGPNVRRWVTGEAKPSLGVLLDLSYVLRCPPASIVTGQPMLTAMEVLAAPPPRPPRKSPRRRSNAELTRFRVALTRIAEGDPARMPTLNEVARQLGCRRSYLTYRFRDHSRKIRRLAEVRRRAEAAQRRLGRQHQAAALLRRLAKKGVYPSDRHLAAAGATWHILQDPGCRRLIKAARATLRAA